MTYPRRLGASAQDDPTMYDPLTGQFINPLTGAVLPDSSSSGTGAIAPTIAVLPPLVTVAPPPTGPSWGWLAAAVAAALAYAGTRKGRGSLSWE
jgi:hypothetical protein